MDYYDSIKKFKLLMESKMEYAVGDIVFIHGSDEKDPQDIAKVIEVDAENSTYGLEHGPYTPKKIMERNQFDTYFDNIVGRVSKEDLGGEVVNPHFKNVDLEEWLTDKNFIASKK